MKWQLYSSLCNNILNQIKKCNALKLNALKLKLLDNCVGFFLMNINCEHKVLNTPTLSSCCTNCVKDSHVYTLCVTMLRCRTFTDFKSYYSIHYHFKVSVWLQAFYNQQKFRKKCWSILILSFYAFLLCIYKKILFFSIMILIFFHDGLYILWSLFNILLNKKIKILA